MQQLDSLLEALKLDHLAQQVDALLEQAAKKDLGCRELLADALNHFRLFGIGQPSGRIVLIKTVIHQCLKTLSPVHARIPGIAVQTDNRCR